jgi:hypothetical protein
MKNIFSHLKTSSIMSGNGLVSFAGIQFLSTNLADNFYRTLAIFLFSTAMGVGSKLVLDRISPKKELDK